MGLSSKIVFLTLLIALSPLIALEPAGGQGLPGNRDKPFDRPPVATPNLGKPTFKPDGKFKHAPSAPKFGEEKLIKKGPGQPTGDLPAAGRSTYRDKTLTAPNSSPNARGTNTSGRAQTGSGDSQQLGEETASKKPKTDELKSGTKDPEGQRSARTAKDSANDACKSCRASCSKRWRTSCGSSTSCRSKYDACMRGCLDGGCSG